MKSSGATANGLGRDEALRLAAWGGAVPAAIAALAAAKAASAIVGNCIVRRVFLRPRRPSGSHLTARSNGVP